MTIPAVSRKSAVIGACIPAVCFASQEVDMFRSISIAAAVILAFIAGIAAPCGSEERMSFDSPGVTNLSGYLKDAKLSLQRFTPIKIDPLALDAARLMLRAPQIGRNDPKVVGISDMYAPKSEPARIEADKTAVSRDGQTLSVKPESGPPVVFQDWSVPAGDETEGDARHFMYLGRAAHNGFYRVEALYAHDSPGSFFINPKNGRIVYAHNGIDTVAISPDGKRMLVLNDGLNPPFGLVVANLSYDEPAIELLCRGSAASQPGHIVPVFKSWHLSFYAGFDLVLVVEQKPSKTAATFAAMPLRFSQQSDGWHVSASNAAELERIAGLRCYQKPAASK